MGRVAFSLCAPALLAFACASSERRAPSSAAATVVVGGRVIDLRGEPVPAANVRVLSPREPRTELARGVADGDGIFRIEGVPHEQRWHVEAEVPGRYAGMGVVRDAQQRPAPSVRVWLRPWDLASGEQRSGSLDEVITDARGRYRFVGVPPGGAFLQMLVEPEEAHPQSRVVAPFDVEPGAALTFDLQLPGR